MYIRQVNSNRCSRGATLGIQRLGSHPIIAHFLARLNVESIVSSCVGAARQGVLDHGQTLCVLTHNLLASPGPLYRIAEWAALLEPNVLGISRAQKEALNDDRVARALDALVTERGRNIWFRLTLRIIKQFEIDTRQMHQDTTTVTFHGKYQSSVAAPCITRGYNKDHRPDLKQLVFGLTVSADGAVPILHQVHSGNRTDDRIHHGNVETLRGILGRTDFTYVADSKLCTINNLGHIAQYGGFFVTVMPRTWKEDKQFRKKLRFKPVRWREILRIANHRRHEDLPNVFSSCECRDQTAHGYRIVWIRSSQKAQEDTLHCQKLLQWAQAQLGELKLKLNHRRLRSKKAIRQAVDDILEKTHTKSLIRVDLQSQTQWTSRRLKRGRPAAKDPVRRVKQIAWSLRIELDHETLAGEKRTDGVFPLLTNRLKLSKREVLMIYKYQPYVEKRFAALKTDLEIAPVYLKKPLRAVGLIHAYFVTLALASLIEREVRRGMKRQGIKSLPLLPEGRPTSTPTCQRILEAFSDVSWYEYQRREDVVAFPIELTDLQRTLLRLLDVPLEVYR